MYWGGIMATATVNISDVISVLKFKLISDRLCVVKPKDLTDKY